MCFATRIASDIYGKEEYKKETGKDVGTLPPPTTKGPDGELTYTCRVCGDPITEQEAGFSNKMFKKALCREHQAEAKNK